MQNNEDMTPKSTNGRETTEIRSRNDPFAEKIHTKIWEEVPSTDNPFIAASCALHGYDLIDLMKRSFSDVFYLMFRGELPAQTDSEILQALMIALINPGIRHPATRAAMNAGVGKSLPIHILPIASAVLGGDYAGGGEIEDAMRFIARNSKTAPELIAAQLAENDEFDTPGFGVRHGGIELMATSIANRLLEFSGAGDSLKWVSELSKELQSKNVNRGLLITGVAAAVFSDLGFQPKSGGCLFQLLGSPGLIAHGLEMSGKPLLAMPFVKDENYFIEKNEQQ